MEKKRNANKIKNKDGFYLDKLIRTQKAASLLSLIHATYHTEDVGDNVNRKEKIAKALQCAYTLFRNKVRNGDDGAGSYKGEVHQFEKQYTIGHELGIWIDSELHLNPYAKLVAENFITIREYIDTVLLNYIQGVKNKIVHILFIILEKMEEKNTDILTTDIIKEAFSKYVRSKNKKDDAKVENEKDDTKVEKERDSINGFFELFSGTTYFKEENNNELRLTIPISILKSKCNLEHHLKHYDEVVNIFGTSSEKFATYLTTYKGSISANESKPHQRIFFGAPGTGESYKLNEETKGSNSANESKPHQRIFFGAPGTGKSYKLNEEAKGYFEDRISRVTFHPNYMYGNFIGAFKPFPKVSEENGKTKETIVYEYVPGVLMQQLVNAFKDPKHNYLLVIEEINRANVAAVFGDFFQLLDRNSEGNSEYTIATSKELQEYLKVALNGVLNDFSEIYLPNNFYIWSTMNSADQGVMPMDTAFRRRWEFEYIGIDEVIEGNKEFDKYTINIDDKGNEISWNVFRKEINKRLSTLNIPEDKLIGPYFIPKHILVGNKEELTKVVKNKVLMYLYEDVARPFRKSLFAEGKYSTYSTLCNEFVKDALNIFKTPIDPKLIKGTKINNDKIEEKDPGIN